MSEEDLLGYLATPQLSSLKELELVVKGTDDGMPLLMQPLEKSYMCCRNSRGSTSVVGLVRPTVLSLE